MFIFNNTCTASGEREGILCWEFSRHALWLWSSDLVYNLCDANDWPNTSKGEITSPDLILRLYFLFEKVKNKPVATQYDFSRGFPATPGKIYASIK